MPFNFSALCNFGVAHSTGGIICFLNNDTEFLSKSAFQRARAWLSMSHVGILGARLLFPTHAVQHFGVVTGVGPHGVAGHAYLGHGEFEHSNFSKSILVQQFSAVTGACMFIRKADFEHVGGFDINLPVAYNDVDLCISVRNTGKIVICDPDIKLLHKESRTRGYDVADTKKTLRLLRDANFIKNKWGEKLRDVFYSPYFSTRNPDFKLADIPRVKLPWKAKT